MQKAALALLTTANLLCGVANFYYIHKIYRTNRRFHMATATQLTDLEAGVTALETTASTLSTNVDALVAANTDILAELKNLANQNPGVDLSGVTGRIAAQNEKLQALSTALQAVTASDVAADPNPGSTPSEPTPDNPEPPPEEPASADSAAAV